jgi:nucleotide-binding universal stress UspA family protein
MARQNGPIDDAVRLRHGPCFARLRLLVVAEQKTHWYLPRAPTMLPIRTILHPTDFSEHARYAFRLACALARDYGAKLIVLHVAEPPIAVYGEGVIVPVMDPIHEEAKNKLHNIRPPDPEEVYIEHRMLEGDPPEEILAVAKELPCELIVMGTHGRTGLRRLIMGSVAEEVVRKALCPVLTVRTPAFKGDEAEEPAEVVGSGI